MVINLIGSLAEFRRIISIRNPLIQKTYTNRAVDRNNSKKKSYMVYFENKRHRLSWTFNNQIRPNSYLVTLDFRVAPYEFRVVYQGVLAGTSVPEKFLDIVHDVEIYFGDREEPKKEERGHGEEGKRLQKR